MVTEGIDPLEQAITRPEIAFRKQQSCVSTRKPFSVNREKSWIQSSCPIHKTSACHKNLRKTVAEVVDVTKSNTWNDVLTMKFPRDKCDPSPLLSLTFRALFQTTSFCVNRVPSTGALAVQSTITSTSYKGSWIQTVRRGLCRVVYPTVADGLLTRFSDPLQILTWWFVAVLGPFEPLCW